MTNRSSRPEVRNPVLALPAARQIAELPDEVRQPLRELLLELSRDAAERAEKSWTNHKPPMAVYWKSIAVYARHIARAIS